MKDEKKEYFARKQMYESTVKRNKKIGLANMFILGTGLILKYIGMSDIGEHFIWLGVVILLYTFGSNMMAKKEMKKYAPKSK